MAQRKTKQHSRIEPVGDHTARFFFYGLQFAREGCIDQSISRYSGCVRDNRFHVSEGHLAGISAI